MDSKYVEVCFKLTEWKPQSIQFPNQICARGDEL